jgi:hypothetical protein
MQLHGQEYLTYEGLLDIAHQKGLKSIQTAPVQIPSDENGHVAIFHAHVEMEDERVFEATGDASKANVSRGIQDAIIRMAETRAKRRALGDAVNYGAEHDVDSAPQASGELAAVESMRGAAIQEPDDEPVKVNASPDVPIDRRGIPAAWKELSDEHIRTLHEITYEMSSVPEHLQPEDPAKFYEFAEKNELNAQKALRGLQRRMAEAE